MLAFILNNLPAGTLPACPVTLTGSGGLFTRLGKIGAGLVESNAARGSTLAARVAAIRGQYNATDGAVVDGLYSQSSQYAAALGNWPTYLAGLARQTATAMLADAHPSLPDGSLGTALAQLVADLLASGDTVQRNAVSLAVAAAPANAGNPSWALSTLLRTGLAAENLFAETLAATVADDAEPGDGAALGREPVVIRGTPAADPLAAAWPAGSGASVRINLVDASQDGQGGSGQYLTNGDFEDWTANVPDNWTIGVGSAGATVRPSAAAYDGALALSFVGTGSERTEVYQTLGVDTGPTPGVLAPYAVNAWVRVDSPPAAGVLEIALTNAAGAVLNDAQGRANALTVDLTTVGTGYAAASAVFRTPAALSGAVRLRVRLSTPLTAGRTVCVDRLALAGPAQLYAQGPYVAAFSGSTPVLRGDSWTLTAANAGGLASFNRLLDALFGTRSLGLILPTSASPTISDSLIS